MSGTITMTGEEYDAMHAEVEALLAENARLRGEISDLYTTMMAAAVEIQEHWAAHCDEDGYGPANLMYRLENGIAAQYGYTAQTLVQLEAERDDARAQLAAIQGGMGEVVEVVAWRHFGDASRLLCDLGKQRSVPGDYAAEFNIPLMTVAQHERITAAMAAEVERWERNFRDIHEPALRDAHAYIQELRAELAEVKGREAACFVVGKLEKTAVVDSPLPVGTKLYALPPASPDVEGLVKALEQAIADIEDWAAYASPYFQEKHDLAGCLEKHRTALSTWRQAQDGATKAPQNPACDPD